MISGGHLFVLGGIGFIANALVNPLTGILAGFTGRFFSQERVISPLKALFIGVFPPVLHMQLLLIFTKHPDKMIDNVNMIGLPLVLSNSIAIAIFTAMIGLVLKEQENEAAFATQKGLSIAEDAIPFLKKDSKYEMAKGIALLLYERLHPAAVSVTDDSLVLAHEGIGGDHHIVGGQVLTSLSNQSIQDRKKHVAYSREDINCIDESCPFEGAIVIPIQGGEQIHGLIKLYFTKAQDIRPVELVLAEGLGHFISNQLYTIHAGKLKNHIRDAELRALQAQINPHFLFNTLHLIAALYRVDARKARDITIKLADFMRFNIGIVSSSLITLKEECKHVTSYIDIIQTRFHNRMTIHFRMDEGIGDKWIPPSTIQPLVENSVRHGLANIYI